MKQDIKQQIPENQVQTFPNRMEVQRWLDGEGWQVSKSTLYNSIGKAKLLPRDDGRFHEKDIRKYARTFLKRKDTGKRIQDKHDELQRRKASLEVEKLELELERARHRRDVEAGMYIPREQIEIEMAGRAAVLDAGLTHMIQSEARGWIEIVEGDPALLPGFVDTLMQRKNAILNQYAQVKEFIVKVEG